jgi:broad specificity phosphatase PhoE
VNISSDNSSWITLVRHGPPNHDVQGLASAQDFADWIFSYSRARVVQVDIPEELKELGAPYSQVFCSTLPRSRTSAKLIFPDKVIQESALYDEAALPTIKLPFVQLPVGLWAVISRLWWLCGYSHGIESYTSAKQRARQAAETLANVAQREGQAMVVGHGWMNRLIGGALRDLGWIKISSNGAGFWSTSSYRKNC